MVQCFCQVFRIYTGLHAKWQDKFGRIVHANKQKDNVVIYFIEKIKGIKKVRFHILIIGPILDDRLKEKILKP